MDPRLKKAQLSAERIALIAGNNPKYTAAVITGSGLGGAIDELGVRQFSLSASLVPGFSEASVEGHHDEIVGVDVDGRHVIILPRTHLYQGSMDAAMHPVRTARALGCQSILLASACGGANPAWALGEVVVVMDHINMTGQSPFRFEYDVFPNQDAVYSPGLASLAFTVDTTLKPGIEVVVHGPEIETPAEVRMFRAVGEHAAPIDMIRGTVPWGVLIGMSGPLEAMVAHQQGMQVFAVGIVSDISPGMTDVPFSHKNVVAVCEKEAPRVGKLFREMILRL